MKETIRSALPPLESLVKFNETPLDTPEYVQGGIHSDSVKNKHFTVYKDKQTWYCYRCGVGGDIFDFVSIMEGVNCSEAHDHTNQNFISILKSAAKIAGIDYVPTQKRQLSETEKVYNTYKRRLKIAIDFYHSKLDTEKRQWVKDKYGLNDDIIDRYLIGFAPINGSDVRAHLFDYANVKDAEEIGISKRKESGGHYDVFKGRIIFPYFVNNDPVFMIGRETPWTPKFEGRDVPKYKKQYVNGTITEPLFGIDTIRGQDYVIITEGITDALSLIQLGYPVLSPVTVRFKQKHIELLKLYTEGKKVYICNDSEENNAGLDGALSTLDELDDGNIIILPRGKEEKVDVNSYLLTHTKEDFDKLIDKSLNKAESSAMFSPSPTHLFIPALEENDIDPERVREKYNRKEKTYEYYNIDYIFDGIHDMKMALARFRRVKGSRAVTIEQNLRKRVMFGAIRRDMNNRGKFINDGENLYYFNRDNKKMYSFGDKLKALMNSRYNIGFEDSDGRHIFSNLRDWCHTDGDFVIVHKIFHYEDETKKLYMYDFGHQYYVLDGESIERFENGSHGFYFIGDGDEWEYLDNGKTETPQAVIGVVGEGRRHLSEDYLSNVLVDRTRFSLSAMNQEQQRDLLWIYLHTLPFADILDVRPISCFIGEKGSGKTYTLKMIGKFLFGMGSEVSLMPDKADDFYVLVSNRPVFFIDNLDEPKDWANDALAVCATGIEVAKRKLYTDFGEATHKPKCFLGITSRTGKFNRDDVSDRMLIFHVERFERFISDAVLTTPIRKSRNILWTQYLDNLNKVVNKLRTCTYDTTSTQSRMAGWSMLAKTVHDALEIPSSFDEMVENLENEKSTFTVRYRYIYTLLERWVAFSEGEFMSSTEIADVLNSEAKRKEEKEVSPIYVGKMLSAYYTEFKQIYGMEIERDGGRNKYRFPTGKESYNAEKGKL